MAHAYLDRCERREGGLQLLAHAAIRMHMVPDHRGLTPHPRTCRHQIPAPGNFAGKKRQRRAEPKMTTEVASCHRVTHRCTCHMCHNITRRSSVSQKCTLGFQHQTDAHFFEMADTHESLPPPPRITNARWCLNGRFRSTYAILGVHPFDRDANGKCLSEVADAKCEVDGRASNYGVYISEYVADLFTCQHRAL